jgi:nucleotide-binding universal stress UspA family protein
MTTEIPPARVSIRRVLAATDFSSLSQRALRQAISIARRYDARFYIAHVVSSWGFNVAGYNAAVEASRLAQTDLEKLVAGLITSGALKDVDHEIVVAIGDFWEALRRIAASNDIDLIVIGTHGHVGMEKMVMGSVAESVFRYARRPVLTVGPCVPDVESFTSTRRSILFPTDFSTASVAALPYAISIANEHGAELGSHPAASGPARYGISGKYFPRHSKISGFTDSGDHFGCHVVYFLCECGRSPSPSEREGFQSQ